jgi:anaerobic selenocysteine-containing dehydrogenase
MHWFDRLSRQIAAAPESQTTRRGVLKGVGAAAVATPFAAHTAAAVAAPFASHTATYAKNSIKARQASSGCTSCLLGAYKEYVADNRNIKKFFASYGRKPKLTARQAAALNSYLAGNRRFLIQDLNTCRTGSACAPSPAPPGTGVIGCICC